MKFFVLLHTAERPKRSFSCFCTLRRGQKEDFHASAHCRKTKKKFFILLHTAERLKRSFSCFCTLQKGQKEVFHASARCRKTKKRFFMLLHTAERPKVDFSRFCTLQKDKKEIFSPKSSRGSMEFWLQLLYDNNVYRTAVFCLFICSFNFFFLPLPP